MIEDAGHAAFEHGIAQALVVATERFKLRDTLLSAVSRAQRLSHRCVLS